MARRPQGWLRVAAATVLALLALWGGVLSAPLLVVLIALIVGALVTVDADARLKRLKAEKAVVAKK